MGECKYNNDFHNTNFEKFNKKKRYYHFTFKIKTIFLYNIEWDRLSLDMQLVVLQTHRNTLLNIAFLLFLGMTAM